MTSPDTPRHVEIKDGAHTVAAAEVTTSQEADGTAQASLHAGPGHIAPGTRASLVDAVMELPEVQESARLEVTVPLGDSESIERVRERTEDTDTRAALPRCWTRRYRRPANRDPVRSLAAKCPNRNHRSPCGADAMRSREAAGAACAATPPVAARGKRAPTRRSAC
jgi:hypothetical protein